jgi:PAS domain S-box-containing protein
VRAVLRRLGEAARASRVYIFENFADDDGELWARQRYEWVAAGVPAQIDNPVLKAIPYKAAGFGRWVQSLGRGDPVYGHVRDLPNSEQPELRAQEILSIAIVPIFVEGRWWGVIGFDECFEEREWSAAEVGALGAAAGTLGAAINRRQMEEHLRAGEERYRAVIEQTTDGIYLLDAETRRFVETNPSFQKMVGYTADELGTMDIYRIVDHPRENFDSTIQRTLEERRRVVGNRKYRRKDGVVLDVEVGVSVISLDGRDVICTIVRDVTERKLSEAALRESERLYRTVIEQATENILLIDVESRRIVESNAAFRESLGYSEAELHSMTIYDVVAADRESIDANIRRVLVQGNPSVGERKYIRNDGTLLDMEVSANHPERPRGERGPREHGSLLSYTPRRRRSGRDTLGRLSRRARRLRVRCASRLREGRGYIPHQGSNSHP